MVLPAFRVGLLDGPQCGSVLGIWLETDGANEFLIDPAMGYFIVVIMY